MYLVFFCFKKPVKSENKIEILLPLVHWCESIHNKLQSLTTFSSDTNSRLRSLLLVSIAECLPRSNHESTYLVGSKRRSGGPTNLVHKSEDTVVVINNCKTGRQARLLGVNILVLTLSVCKVIIYIFHNLEKVSVRRTGAYRHKKSTG